MTRLLAVLPLLSVFCLAAYGDAREGAGVAPVVGIFLDFENVPSQLSVDQMKRQVSAILKPSGLLLNWKLLEENRGDESFTDLVVMRFKGKCAIGPGDLDFEEKGWPREKVVMGATRMSEGRVLPFSEVECDQVRRCLPFAGVVNVQQQQFALGRALGNVVAHELYHILAKTAGHAKEGLAKATQSWKDLVRTPMGFQESDSRAIWEGAVGTRGIFSFSGR